MATCGEYELERAIGWGRRSTFFSARAANDRGPSLIVIRRARSGDRAFAQAFLRAAAEQQTAVMAGCRRLAPILAFEHDDAGFAFYATTRYETSLAEFLEAECKVDNALLREIVSSVLVALAELHEKSRRAHGNLTPGNILLDPQGRIFLTDLAPSAKDATTADDLFGLGKLIYQLVRRTARIGTLSPPLDYSPAWTESLGDDAEGWLAFTNRLLDKARNGSPDAIKSAIGDLRSLSGLVAKAAKAAKIAFPKEGGTPAVQVEIRRPPPRKKNRLPAILVVLLLLGGGGGGFLWWKKQEKKKAAQAGLEKKEDERRKRLMHLPQSLKNLRAEMKNLPSAITNDKTLNYRLQLIDASLGEAPTESIEKDTENNLRNWSLPDTMKAKATEWRAGPHGWKILADKLEAASSIDLEGETSLIKQLENAITADSAASELDFLWADIERTLKELSATKNPVLPDFTAWAEREIRSAGDLKKTTDRAQEAVRTLGKVLAFQSDFGSRIRWARLEEKVPDIRQKPSEELMSTWPSDWMNKAKVFVAPETDKITAWEKQLAGLDAQFQKLSPKDPKRPGWKQQLDAARDALREPLETDAPAIEKKLAGLRGMKTEMEIAHDQFKDFLEPWQDEVKKLTGFTDIKAAKDQAEKLLKQFRAATDALLPEYKVKLGSSKLASDFQGHLNMKDRLSLVFSHPDGSPVTNWRPALPPAKYTDPNAACYAFVKSNREYAYMHFLPLDPENAMAVWETPLALARFSGMRVSIQRDEKNVPTDGLQTRDDDFNPAVDWQWKSVKDMLLTLGKRPIDYFAPGLKPPIPNDQWPVTWLTFDEAKKMAETLGGKLPTAAQWKTAYTMMKPGAEARLRSPAAWSKQYPLRNDWKRDTKDPFGPESAVPEYGSFSKQFKEFESDKDAGGRDDKLWLAEVGDPNWNPSQGFIHLVGNAAEWVTDENGKPAVIGSSVLAPKIPPDRAFPAINRAYCDVSFRLIVPRTSDGPGVGLKNFINAAAELTAP